MSSCGTTLHLQRVLSFISVQIFLSLGITEYGPQAHHLGNDFTPLLMSADARTIKYTTPRGIRNRPYFKSSEQHYTGMCEHALTICNALPNPVTNSTHSTINTSITQWSLRLNKIPPWMLPLQFLPLVLPGWKRLIKWKRTSIKCHQCVIQFSFICKYTGMRLEWHTEYYSYAC